MARDPVDVSVEEPPVPAGYTEPNELEYPPLVLFGGSSALALLAAGLFGWLLWQIQGPAAFSAIIVVEELETGTIVTQNLTAVTIAFLAALLVTVVIHELLHGLAFTWFGYAVSYGVVLRKGAFYTAALGQYQQREQLVVVALTPLVVLTAVAIPLLFVPVSLVAVTAYLVLILNTAGSIGDIYMAWRIWRLPPESLVLDLDLNRMYAYVPADRE